MATHLTFIVAVVTLITAAVVVHVSCTSSFGSHGEITETFRVLFGVSTSTTAAVLNIIRMSAMALIIVLLVVVVVLATFIVAARVLFTVVFTGMFAVIIAIVTTEAIVSFTTVSSLLAVHRKQDSPLVIVTVSIVRVLVLIVVPMLIVLVIGIAVALMAVAIVVMASRHDGYL